MLRRLILVQNDVRPASFNFRRRGAPRHCWHNCVFNHCLKAAGGLNQLRQQLYAQDWKLRVKSYVGGLATDAWFYS